MYPKFVITITVFLELSSFNVSFLKRRTNNSALAKKHVFINGMFLLQTCFFVCDFNIHASADKPVRTSLVLKIKLPWGRSKKYKPEGPNLKTLSIFSSISNQ